MWPLEQHELSLLAILVLLAPLLALIVPVLIQVSKKQLQLRFDVMGWATRLLSLFSLACSALLALGPADQFPLTFRFGVWFYLDALSVYFVLLVNLVAFFASWYTVNFLAHDRRYSGERHDPAVFHIFFNAFHLTMLIVPMVDNLIVLWMAIELTTLASTLLVRYRRRRRTLEATWKYIIITTAGIVFALFGTILLTVAISDETCQRMASLEGLGAQTCQALQETKNPQELGLMSWSVLAQKEVAETLDPKLVLLSFVFVLVGYGTKAGLAPMHPWLPDGHGEAPSPVSALLSGVLLKSALYAILRFYTITNLNRQSAEFTSIVLLFSGLLSLILATPFILKRNRFKRILAYHSLEHMGIIVFGLGIGGQVALFGALLHALNHALTKAFMFLTFSNIRREYARQQGSGEPNEEEIRGVLTGMPVSGTMLLYGGLGLVGSPPFNIFLSELIILWAALQRVVQPASGEARLSAGFYAAAVALFLLSVTLIFGGLVLHLARILLGRPPDASGDGADTDRSGKPRYAVRELPKAVLPLVALALVIVIFGVWIPTWPIDFPGLLQRSVMVLQKGASAVARP